MSKELLWTFPVTIQSLFEGKSTGILRTIKPITDTVIIRLFKSLSHHVDRTETSNTMLSYTLNKIGETFYEQTWVGKGGRGGGGVRRRRVKCMDPGRVLIWAALTVTTR